MSRKKIETLTSSTLLDKFTGIFSMVQPLYTKVTSVNKKAIPLYLFSFIMVMPVVALFPVLPQIREELNTSYSQIAVFIACLGIVRICLAFPSGVLADRFDRKKILLLAGILSVAGLLILGFAENIFHLIVSRILIGSGSIISTITVLVLLAQIGGFNRKGASISMNNVVHSAGGIISPAMAGILAGWFNWRLPFFVFAGLVLLSMLMIAMTFSDQRAHDKLAKKTNGLAQRFHSGGNVKVGIFKLVPIFSLGFFVFFYRGGFRHTLIPLYGKDVLNIGVEALGFYISLMACIAMVSIIILGFMSDRYGRKVVLIPGIFFSMIAVMSLLLPEELNPLLPACIFVGVGAIINSMPNILLSDLVPQDALGKTLGMNRIFSDSGYFLGALIAGNLLEGFGFRVPLYVIAAFCVFILMMVFFYIPNRPFKK